MRIVRFILRGLVGFVVLIGGAVLVYMLTRPRPSALTVTPLTPAVPPVAPPPDIIARAEKAVKLDRETRPEIPPDGAKKRGRPPKARDTRLDLNTVTAAELEALPRIGPALAKRIVTYREDYGRFNNVTDIQKVNGIGASVLEAIKDLVRV